MTHRAELLNPAHWHMSLADGDLAEASPGLGKQSQAMDAHVLHGNG
jgi:hypothetical protein